MSLRLSNNYFSHYIEDKNIYFHFEEVPKQQYQIINDNHFTEVYTSIYQKLAYAFSGKEDYKTDEH